LAVVHFAIAAACWGLAVAAAIKWDFSRQEWLGYIVHPGWPCIGLLALSVVCLVLALRRRRVAGVLLVVSLTASALMFWYDVSHQRWQMRVDIAQIEYWEQGGREHTYITWWWYNDRWLQQAATSR
jgi:MYXO-CTERM domain-containing protein